MDYELIEETILNQIKIRKKTENQCQNAACEQKTLARNENLIQTKKLGLE